MLLSVKKNLWVAGILLLLTLCLFLFRTNIRYRNEKKQLIDLLSKYHDYYEGLGFKPALIPISSEINLGDNYEAEIFLAFIDYNSPPKVIVENGYKRDTLKYDKYGWPLYKITPDKRGTFPLNGTVIYKDLKRTRTYKFESSYTVK